MSSDSSAAVLTIDGPSGSGKGTIARQVANQLGWHLLDSGALYRLVALDASKQGIKYDDANALADLAASLDVTFLVGENGNEQIMLSGEDVSAAVRSEEVGIGASSVAVIPAVREALLRTAKGISTAPWAGGRWPRHGHTCFCRRTAQSLPDGERRRAGRKAP